MEHKAFTFRYSECERELLPLLQGALVSSDPQPLVAFIEAARASLRDPYEGEPLGDDWQDLLETKDVHQYGDFALTKYYDPTADIGLGRAWEEIQRVLESELGGSSAILGRPVGTTGAVFDPGKMGSYFQSETDVRRNLAAIESANESRLEPVAVLLRRALYQGAGLYVTF
jgi:hypothetical protein